MRYYNNDDCTVPADNRDVTCLIGRDVFTEYRVSRDHHVHCNGRIVNIARRGNNSCIYGVSYSGYNDSYGRPIVVDFLRSQFILPRRVA